MLTEKQTILLARVRLGASRRRAGKLRRIGLDSWQLRGRVTAWLGISRSSPIRGGGKRDALNVLFAMLQAATAAQTQRCAVRRTRHPAAAGVYRGGFTGLEGGQTVIIHGWILVSIGRLRISALVIASCHLTP